MESVRIWSFSGRKSLYSVQMRENTDQKNSEYVHFSRSEYVSEVLWLSAIIEDDSLVLGFRLKMKTLQTLK